MKLKTDKYFCDYCATGGGCTVIVEYQEDIKDIDKPDQCLFGNQNVEYKKLIDCKCIECGKDFTITSHKYNNKQCTECLIRYGKGVINE
jgi:hypothetical protein